MNKLIKTDIALDYPAVWKFDRVLRDLIQNFYDCIGKERFGIDFVYEYTEDPSGTLALKMETKDHPFNYEWLVYIGGSTKTGSRGDYIGKFGEGFKICMLNLLRMGIEDVTMHSQNWSLHPCVYYDRIDHVSFGMLGYEYTECENDSVTSLIIEGIPTKHRDSLEEGLLHFFYPENPLFGKKMCEMIPEEGSDQTNRYCIYIGSDKKVVCRDHPECKGIFYYNHLARGRLPFPLFVDVSGKRFDFSESRKREIKNAFEVWQNMYILATCMNPEDSLLLLLFMQDYWNDIPAAMCDINSWYYVICQLVRNVASSPDISERFKKDWPHLVYIERKTSDSKRNHLIDQTTVWARKNNKDKLVSPVFRMLGAVSLVEKFNLESVKDLRLPDASEKKKIDLLIGLYKEIVPKDEQVSIPEVWINKEVDAKIDPLYFADRCYLSGKRSHQKYILNKIVLNEEDLAPDRFEYALLNFMEIMFHAYGGPCSNRMNVYFTDLGGYFIDHADTIMKACQVWQTAAYKNTGKYNTGKYNTDQCVYSD